jgi:propanol-preferring alcohol dehydrogenase
MRGESLAEGDPVLVYGGWGCGACRECLAGSEQRCADSVSPGFQVDGGYAEATLVPHPRHLEPLGVLDPVRAAPLADAGVTAHRAVARASAWLTPDARVLVIGAGGVGGFVIQLLRRTPHGERLVIGVRERSAARLRRAVDLGADAAELSEPADVVIDVVGSAETMAEASDAVAPGGLVVLVGEGGGELRFGFDATPLEAWFTTVAWGSRDDLTAVTRAARAGELRWETEAVPLREVAAAHERMRSGSVDGRLVLVPSDARPVNRR